MVLHNKIINTKHLVLIILYTSIIWGGSYISTNNCKDCCKFIKHTTNAKDIRYFLETEQKSISIESIKQVISNGREGVFEVSYTENSNVSGYFIFLVVEHEIYQTSYSRKKNCYKKVRKILNANKTLEKLQKQKIIEYFKHLPNPNL
jgi:hypothetical protein